MKHSIDQLAVHTIRTLTIDAVNKANSGHPGMPMGAAPMAYELWSRHMKVNPHNPNWMNRDRFVLSAGHGSMLLYSLLHLLGYTVSLDDLKQFRQWGSLTPGHPEYGHTPGVDATTGPLGQGVGMAVGMAIAEAHLSAVFNRDGFPVIDHNTYVLCGDGDLMEGVTGEASSLAGHLQLGKLIMLYDSNDISLDGDLKQSFSENVQKRFGSYSWHVQRVEDGNDLEAIGRAIVQAKSDPRPSLIEVKTVIGYGSPNKSGKAGEHGSHGVPLGREETELTKQAYGWPTEPDFYIPDEVNTHFSELREQGAAAESAWLKLVSAYKQANPDLADSFEALLADELPTQWTEDLPVYYAGHESIATRSASENAMNAIANKVQLLIGGSADLETSTKTRIQCSRNLTKTDYRGRNVFYGVREFAMGAALNGMMLHKGLRAFAATFFVFSDYLRPAIRLAAIMRLPVLYVFTHDSIAVGEDGPTHEPIEQLAALRCIPGVVVLRPADANETSMAWKWAMENKLGPCALILSRQPLPVLANSAILAKHGVERGAYVLSDSRNSTGPAALIIATGSEVQLAIAAQVRLEDLGIPVRVISMPSWELFVRQPKSYKDSVLLPHVKKRLAVEMGSAQGWHPFVGDHGAVLGIDRFGASAPASIVMKQYGFTVENVVNQVLVLLDKNEA